MRKSEFKQNDIVAVLWLDAVSDPKWLSSKDAESYQLAKVVTIGFYLNQDKKAFRLSSSISGDERDVNVIPIKWIEKITKLSNRGIKI